MKLKGDQLWIASNRVQNIMGNVTDTDFRFRVVWIRSIRLLLETVGRKCLTGITNTVNNNNNNNNKFKYPTFSMKKPVPGHY